MNTTETALLVVSTLGFVTSATTLVIVLVGGRKMKTEFTDARTKVNKTVNTLKTALDTLEL